MMIISVCCPSLLCAACQHDLQQQSFEPAAAMATEWMP